MSAKPEQPANRDSEKFATVINKNTFFFVDQEFENGFEAELSSIKETISLIKRRFDAGEAKETVIEDIILGKENGLNAVLTLTGFSRETLLRIITLVRVSDNQELASLVNKEKWASSNGKEFKEWGESKIKKEIKNNELFRKGLVNLLFQGSSVAYLAQTIPLFELKKLSSSKFNFETTDLIDTLVRYKVKGSLSVSQGKNAETVIEKLLTEMGVKFEKGIPQKLSEALDTNKNRDMDFIIPSKDNPKLIIESSYVVTTSSTQGDKSKTEITVGELLKKHYPECIFIGFVDGVGWYVRQGDLKRMVSAYDDVFTFHNSEINRFKDLLRSIQ